MNLFDQLVNQALSNNAELAPLRVAADTGRVLADHCRGLFG